MDANRLASPSASIIASSAMTPNFLPGAAPCACAARTASAAVAPATGSQAAVGPKRIRLESPRRLPLDPDLCFRSRSPSFATRCSGAILIGCHLTDRQQACKETIALHVPTMTHPIDVLAYPAGPEDVAPRSYIRHMPGTQRKRTAPFVQGAVRGLVGKAASTQLDPHNHPSSPLNNASFSVSAVTPFVKR